MTDAHPLLQLADRVAAWATQHALGTGWLTDHDPRVAEHAAQAFAHELALLAGLALDPAQPAAVRARGWRLRLAALTLSDEPDRHPRDAAARSPIAAWRDAMDAAPDRTSAEWLLAAWARGHLHVRPAARRPGHATAEDEAHWAWLTERTRPALAALLSDAGTSLDPERLALWFALDLLEHTRGPRALGSNARRWAVRRSLAWVVREAIRRLLHGHRADYTWQPDQYGEALFDLVEVHAHGVLRLPPQLDVRALLTAFRHPTDHGRLPGYRQHVLALYLSAHFLLGVRHVGQDGERPVDAWLAGAAAQGRATARQTRALRAACALAILHHDVGLLLLRRLADLEPWSPGLELQTDALRGFHTRREADRDELLAVWRAELEASTLLTDLPAGWGDGPDHHGLASAWLLMHVGREAGVDAEILMPALRAVVLHAEPEAIDVGADPVAAVLVLCDQLYEWEPGSLPETGAYLRHAHRRRTRRIRLDGLEVRADDHALTALLTGAPHGPTFTLELHHPEAAPVPIWRTWLSTAQRLGRLTARGDAWRPAVVLESRVPRWLADRDLHTYELLDRVAARPPPAIRQVGLALRDWLGDPEPFTWDHATGVETVRLHPLRCAVDVRAVVEALDEAVTEVIERW